MIVATPPSKRIRSRKRKREIEEAILSADAVSEKNLKETAPMILARWKTAAYNSSSASRKLAKVLREMEASTTRERRRTSNSKSQTRKGVRVVDKRAKWTSARNGFRLNTRQLGSK